MYRIIIQEPMIELKRFAVMLVCILILSMTLTGCSGTEPNASGATESLETLTATGTVDSVEWGDYLHLNITTDSGNALSFFVLKDVKENPETLKQGQRVTVTYENRKQIMDPPGEEIEFLELLSVIIEQ